MSNMRKRLSTAVGCFLGSLILTVPSALSADERDRVCSNATLKGSYGFVTGAIVVPANTPRGVVGRWNFEGRPICPLKSSGSRIANFTTPFSFWQ